MLMLTFIAVIETERMTFQEVKNIFMRKGLVYPKMRQRIVKCFGALYWQDIPEEEFNAILDSLFVDLGKIKPLKTE